MSGICLSFCIFFFEIYLEYLPRLMPDVFLLLFTPTTGGWNFNSLQPDGFSFLITIKPQFACFL